MHQHSIELLPWQSALWMQWQAQIRERRLHHAVMLLAPSGSGRHYLTRALSRALLCQNLDDDACGQCHSCRLYAAQTHPDYHCVEAEEGKKITVDAIRQANRWAVETSQLGGHRIIEIRDAQLLGEAAANALLKTLEEPPQGCHYLLTANGVDGVLPTIISRCSQWRQPYISAEEVTQWLKQSQRVVDADFLHLYQQSPLGIVAKLDAGYLPLLDELVGAFTDLVQPPYLGLNRNAELLVKAGDDGLYWLQMLLLDALKHQQGVEVSLCVYQHRYMSAQRLASHCNAEQLLSQLAKLQTLQSQLLQSSGLNRELLVTQWLCGFIKGESSVS
ncbi:DNA polymerase III subunit delta' C-terminal domain-containing protein [Thaumasiovibrio sp. DFM-14]|uniref:DNA polymerase III subunit delta' C-terminal domain-containing protein n=1 Tax=Thaumasiovibrio sp. DFM-14 TaxID=3384792 RepID=UPI0039A20914